MVLGMTPTQKALKKAGFTEADLKSPDPARRNAAWDIICPPTGQPIPDAPVADYGDYYQDDNGNCRLWGALH